MKPLTASRLAAAMGIGDEAAELWVMHVNTALGMCGCNTPEHVAMWIAQVGHESAGLTRLVESLNYTPEALRATWPTRFSADDALRLGRHGDRAANQRVIANIAYLGRLGNQPGTDDGWNYRGRGPIQVTGRANYRECGTVIGVDLVSDPTLLELRATGASSTAWFWRKHKLTGFGGDVLSVTRRINGGTNGLDDRQARYVRALSVLSSI